MALLDQDTTCGARVVEIAAGQRLFGAGDSGPVWQLVKGVMRLETNQPSEGRLVHLVQTGDLVGAESVLFQSYTFNATAVVASQLKTVDLETEIHRILVLATAFKQGQQRAAEVMQLREGSVAQRLEHLLEILHRASGDDILDIRQRQLPSLRDIASIVNAAPESVCRNLTQRLGRKMMAGVANSGTLTNVVPIGGRTLGSTSLPP